MSNEFPSQPKPEKKDEQEGVTLSPEQIEKIMEKVCDIETEGIAYHALGIYEYHIERGTSGSLLGSVLTNGLSGIFSGVEEKDHFDNKIDPKKYKIKAKEKTHPTYFNIIGRSYSFKSYNTADVFHGKNPKIKGVHAGLGNWGEGPVLLFNLNGFKESNEKGVDTYWVNSSGYGGVLNGKTINDDRNGFMVTSRIPPRNFIGLIVDQILNPYWSEEEYKESNEHTYADIETFRKTSSRQILQEKIILGDVIKNVIEAARGNTERLLPVYDSFGNLIWPKQMSYEEVKAFVVERDAKNSKSESEQQEDVEG